MIRLQSARLRANTRAAPFTLIAPALVATLAATLTLLLAGCVDVQESDASRAADSLKVVSAREAATKAKDPAAARRDSAPSATPAIVSPTSPAPMPHNGADEPTLIRTMGSPAAQEALRTDTAHSIVDSDLPVAVTTAPGDADLTSLRSTMGVPVQGIARSALRDTYDEMRGGTRRHEALDIGAPRGTPVLAATAGRVLKLYSSKAGGLMVYTSDASGQFILMYGHLDAYQPGLAEGQPLTRGQQLGIVGTTGNAPPTVPHLHFAVARASSPKQWWKGTPVNPYPLLK